MLVAKRCYELDRLFRHMKELGARGCRSDLAITCMGSIARHGEYFAAEYFEQSCFFLQDGNEIARVGRTAQI